MRRVLPLMFLLAPFAAAQVYESPVHNERLRSGVHLGGIGCGKIELLTDGALGHYTGNANWDRPVAELPLSFFALAVEDGAGRRVVRALCGGDPAGVPSVADIVFDGRFPQADVVFSDPDLPADVHLHACASFRPGDLAAATVPGALFRFELRPKPGATARRAELWFAFENLAGVGGRTDADYTDRTGSSAAPRREGNVGAVQFATTRTAEGAARNAVATLCIAARGDAAQVEPLGVFNGAGSGSDLAGAMLRGDALLPFATTGEEGRMHPGGVLGARLDLSPRGPVRIDFALAWHAPHLFTQYDEQDHGKPYLDRFTDAFAVAAHLLRDADGVAARSDELERLLHASTLPEWMVRKLLNNLGPLFAGTILTRDLSFSCIESPVTMRGALGTMDQRLSSHAAYTFLFPFLDMRELETFAKLQLPRGQVSHFTGNFNLVMHSVSVPYGHVPWPDLCCSFVLQVDALARWSGDRTFLNAMRPHVQRALDAAHRLDADGDGVPEGGNTFDNRVYDGAVSYTASVYIAALLAGMRIAREVEDSAFEQALAGRLDRARAAVLRSLWNGRWFEKAHDPVDGERSRDCFMAQLAGEFRARLQGLPYTMDPEMTRRATLALLEMNAEVGRVLPLLDVEPGGLEGWTSAAWTQYTETYLLYQAIQQGFAGTALAHLERMAEAQRFQDQSPFNVALVYDVHTGHRLWGDQYMTSTASWFLPRVLLGFDVERLEEPERGATLVLDPRLPVAWEHFRIPIHSPPALLLEVEGDLAGPDRHRRFTIEVRHCQGTLSVGRIVLGLPDGARPGASLLALDGGGSLVAGDTDPDRPDRVLFELPRRLELKTGDRVTLFQVQRDSGHLLVTRDRARCHGAAVTLDSARSKGGDGGVALRMLRDGPWPQVLRVERALLGDGDADRLGDAVRLADNGEHTTVPLLMILPGGTLEGLERDWLGALPAAHAARARDLLARDDASRLADLRFQDGVFLDGMGTPARDALRADFAALRAELQSARNAALAAGDAAAASDLTPVRLDLEFLGNPISDRTLRVRAEIEAPEARWRLDRLEVVPPPGVTVLQAPDFTGRTFVPGRPLQASLVLDMDAEARWRRRSFTIAVEGVVATDPPVTFRKDARISVGYDFVQECLALGPFIAPRGADPCEVAFAPETDGVQPGRAYGEGDRAMSWRPVGTVFQGILSLRELVPSTVPEAAVYAAVDVESPRRQEARLLLGSGGMLRVWHDGQPIHEQCEVRFAAPAQDSVDVVLRPGTNRFLFKVAGPRELLSLLLEVVDRRGESIPDLRVRVPQS